MENNEIHPNCDLNELIARLDADDRYAVHALHHLIKQLVARHGDLTPDKCTWTDKHYLISVLHNTMMALIRRDIRPVALGIVRQLGHCGLLRRQKEE